MSDDAKYEREWVDFGHIGRFGVRWRVMRHFLTILGLGIWIGLAIGHSIWP
jgi:hypothetical protein